VEDNSDFAAGIHHSLSPHPDIHPAHTHCCNHHTHSRPARIDRTAAGDIAAGVAVDCNFAEGEGPDAALLAHCRASLAVGSGSVRTPW